MAAIGLIYGQQTILYLTMKGNMALHCFQCHSMNKMTVCVSITFVRYRIYFVSYKMSN